MLSLDGLVVWCPLHGLGLNIISKATFTTLSNYCDFLWILQGLVAGLWVISNCTLHDMGTYLTWNSIFLLASLQDRHVTHFMSDFILLPAKLLIHTVRHYPHSIVLINRLVSHHCTFFFGLSAEIVTWIKIICYCWCCDL